MNRIVKVSQRVLLVLVALVFAATTVFAAAPMFKVAPKGKKKIRIGVIDLNAAIEVSAKINEAHSKNAKARGWQLEVFDLKDNAPEAGNALDNMVSAGYDAIIIPYLSPKAFDQQVKKAFDKGIAVITIAAMGANYPGVVADIGPLQGTCGAIVAEALAQKLSMGDKVVAMYIPALDNQIVKWLAAKGIFEAYHLPVARELLYPLTGDPFQWGYDQTKNVLLSDSKKEIKGIWDTFDGFGTNAARAAHEMGRDDVLIATIDDTSASLAAMAKLPNMWAASGWACMTKDISAKIFELLDKVFKGEAVQSQKIIPFSPILVTKDNLPPKGYYVNTCGYKGPPDYVVK
jgi:ABC-type sugar transport system substrate-binding protein